MLTPKENFLETLKKDGKPDRLVNQYQPFVPIMNDPLQKFTRGNRVRGKTSVDRWGTEILFPEDAPGPMPHVTEANKVCPDRVTRILWLKDIFSLGGSQCLIFLMHPAYVYRMSEQPYLIFSS